MTVTSLPLYRYIPIFLITHQRTYIVTTETGGCEVTGVLLSNQGHYKMYLLRPRFLVFIPGIRDTLKYSCLSVTMNVISGNEGYQ